MWNEMNLDRVVLDSKITSNDIVDGDRTQKANREERWKKK